MGSGAAMNKNASSLSSEHCISVTTPLLDLDKESEISSGEESQNRVIELEDAEKDEYTINDSPIEQVRLTVPITDDPSQLALTFRTWILGLASCVLLAFVNQFLGYRTNPLKITYVSAQIITLPLGKLMAATLPTKPIQVPFTNFSFSLNPGPFYLKEHVLITIFASSGSSGVYAINIITIVKAFYHRSINPVATYMLALSTHMLGLLKGKQENIDVKHMLIHGKRPHTIPCCCQRQRLTSIC